MRKLALQDYPKKPRNASLLLCEKSCGTSLVPEFQEESNFDSLKAGFESRIFPAIVSWKGCEITSPAFGQDGMTHDGAKWLVGGWWVIGGCLL